ncbi:MAG: hypothetical protein AB8B55_08980 [Mariniblastus sp.]
MWKDVLQKVSLVDKAQLDRIVKMQMYYWIIAIFFATGFAFFSKMWTAKFPILIFLPMLMVAFAMGSIGVIKKELTPLLTNSKENSPSQ